MRTALTIAGSDCSGGAGIQADIKTMTTNGVYAMSVITALTAQNTTGVTGIVNIEPDFVKKQFETVFEDIYPDAIKIGMVSSSEIVEAIACELIKFKAKNIVLDPVMVATSGSKLMESSALKELKGRLFPLARVITPNILEAEVLSGISIKDDKTMLDAAKIIYENHGCAVLLKGGHSINDANDLLYENGKEMWFFGEHINNPNTHGTGCTLSSAIASNLAKGYTLEDSVRKAKDYISGALLAMLDLGKGSGPMNHAFNLKGEYVKESKYEQAYFSI
jgi:phosphomethylpyrimidine kinase